MNNGHIELTKRLAAMLVESIPSDMSENALIKWSNSGPLLEQRVGLLLRDEGEQDQVTHLEKWSGHYRALGFGTALEKNTMEAITVPKKVSGFSRLGIVLPITTDGLIAAASKLFPIFQHALGEHGDDSSTFINDRPSSEPYAFWVRDVGDSEVPPPTGKPRVPPPHPDQPRLTLHERILLEVAYFRDTGQHLDAERVTCCFGTQHPQGNERPVVCYRNGAVHIFWQGDAFTDALMRGSPYWSREMAV